MAKVKRPTRQVPRKAPRKASRRGGARPKMSEAPRVEPAVSAPSEVAADDQIIASNLSLHQLFEQQARQMIERADLDEEQKQTILVAMSCPCCGAGAMSYTAKLRR